MASNDPAPSLRASVGQDAVVAELTAEMGRELEGWRQAQAVANRHASRIAQLQVILSHITRGRVGTRNPEEDDLVSVGLAAQLAKVEKYLVGRWTREHGLEVKKGGRWLVSKSRLLAFLDQKAGRAASISSASQSVSSICWPGGAEHGSP